MAEKKKLLYVLGHGYSGSTLLGLSLGTLDNVLNLGEVINLEKAYSRKPTCTCGQKVADCIFWQGLKNHLENNQKLLPKRQRWHLSENGKREPLDDRGGGITKLKMVLGFSLKGLFGSKEIENYAKKNESFFNHVFDYTKAQWIVDLSKSPERLEVLLKESNLDIYCLYLKRNPFEVYASNLKRPKQNRAKFGFKKIREAIWYRLRTRTYESAFSKVPEGKKMQLKWEDFTKEPIKQINEINKWVGIDAHVEKELVIYRSQQHNFSGNRWLHHNTTEKITIRETISNKTLSTTEKLIFKLFNTI